MKLAEALVLRSDIQKRIMSLRKRISKVTIMQDGDKPAEDPQALLKEARSAINNLEKLIFSINSANLNSQTPKGRSITEALAERDALKLKHALLASAIDSAEIPSAYGVREIRWVSTINIEAIQEEIDAIAIQIREVNLEIQEANWLNDI